MARAESIALAMAGLSLMSGCSWFFVQPLPADPGSAEYFDCTTSRAAPATDTLFALVNIGTTIYVVSDDKLTNRGPAIGVGLAAATLWALSASYGYLKTNECEDAERQQRTSIPQAEGWRPSRPQFYPQPPPSLPAPSQPAPSQPSPSLPAPSQPAPSQPPPALPGTSPPAPSQPPLSQPPPSSPPPETPSASGAPTP